MTEESVLKSEIQKPTISWPGLFLIAAGILLLLSNTLHIHLLRYIWPGFLAGLGVLMVLPAYRSTETHQSRFSLLAVPGAMVLGLSALLFMAGLVDHYESLAYGWPLILAAGAGGLGYARRHERGQVIDERTYRFIRKMVLISMAMAIVFELVIFTSLGPWWPLLLVAGGVYLWTKNRRRND